MLSMQLATLKPSALQGPAGAPNAWCDEVDWLESHTSATDQHDGWEAMESLRFGEVPPMQVFHGICRYQTARFALGELEASPARKGSKGLVPCSQRIPTW